MMPFCETCQTTDDSANVEWKSVINRWIHSIRHFVLLTPLRRFSMRVRRVR